MAKRYAGKAKKAHPKRVPKIWCAVQITTYALRDDGIHRIQFTQIDLHNPEDLAIELARIVRRYPEAFTTSIYIEWRPFESWPKKWREV